MGTSCSGGGPCAESAGDRPWASGVLASSDEEALRRASSSDKHSAYGESDRYRHSHFRSTSLPKVIVELKQPRPRPGSVGVSPDGFESAAEFSGVLKAGNPGNNTETRELLELLGRLESRYLNEAWCRPSR